MTESESKRLGYNADRFLYEWARYSSTDDVTNASKNREAFMVQFAIAKAIISSADFRDKSNDEKYIALWSRINAPRNVEELLRTVIYIYDNFDETASKLIQDKKKFVDSLIEYCNSFDVQECRELNHRESNYCDTIARSVCFTIATFMTRIIVDKINLPDACD
jgi:hypothetical protein